MKLKGYKTLAILALTGTVLITSCSFTSAKFEENDKVSSEVDDNNKNFDEFVEDINNVVTNFLNDLAMDVKTYMKKYIYNLTK